MSKQQEYIDSVDGAAHMSAVRIIAELEAALAAAQERNKELETICRSLGSRVAAAKKIAEEAANE